MDEGPIGLYIHTNTFNMCVPVMKGMDILFMSLLLMGDVGLYQENRDIKNIYDRIHIVVVGLVVVFRDGRGMDGNLDNFGLTQYNSNLILDKVV